MSTQKETGDSEGGDNRERSYIELSKEFAGALRRGDLEECKKIVEECQCDERDKMLNWSDFLGQTFLHTAAEKNQVPIINWLLSEEEGGGRSLGFNSFLTRTEHGGNTALHLAARSGHLEACKAIVNGCGGDNGEREEMLNTGAPVGAETALHCAARSGRTIVVSWLLSSEEGGGRELGFNSILARTIDGHTALHYAAEIGRLETCKAIVNGCRFDNGEREEMLNAVDKRGRTILHIAATYGRAPVASWLMSNKEGEGRCLGFNNVLARTSDSGDTVLHLAAEQENSECFLAIVNGCQADELQEMVNAVDNSGMTILHPAARAGSTSTIRWILSEDGGRAAGFNLVSAQDTRGERTALDVTIHHQEPDATRTILSHCTSKERMNLFLAVDKHGWTALHHAVRRNRANSVAELLSYPECGLMMNRKDNLGMTVLHRAIIGGLDKESRDEWVAYFVLAHQPTVRALLGYNNSPSSSSSSSTAKVTKAWIDPNIGLGLL